MIWWETWLWQVSFALKFHLSNSERILAEASHGGGIIHCCVSDLPIQLPSCPALPWIKLAHTVPQCMQIWLLMTELWRVFNIVNSELLLPVEIKMLPNNLFHKIFIRGMFTVHPIIPSVRSVLFCSLGFDCCCCWTAHWLTDPYAASSAPSSFMRANKGWKLLFCYWHHHPRWTSSWQKKEKTQK